MAIVSCGRNDPQPKEDPQLAELKAKMSQTRIAMAYWFPLAREEIPSKTGKNNFDRFVTDPVTNFSAADSALGANRFAKATQPELLQRSPMLISADSTATAFLVFYNESQALQK